MYVNHLAIYRAGLITFPLTTRGCASGAASSPAKGVIARGLATSCSSSLIPYPLRYGAILDHILYKNDSYLSTLSVRLTAIDAPSSTSRELPRGSPRDSVAVAALRFSSVARSASGNTSDSLAVSLLS